jgi:hypothetical protein
MLPREKILGVVLDRADIDRTSREYTCYYRPMPAKN